MEKENQQPAKPQLALISKYTKRVVLKTVLARPDGGLGLIGQKVVVGGWVKSAKEIRKDPLYSLGPSVAPLDLAKAPSGKTGVNCTEILHIPMPFVRSLLKAFGINHEDDKDKHQGPNLNKLSLPSTVFLQISDGSCVPSLQIVVESSLAPPGNIMLTGTCILIEGIVQKPSSLGPSKHLIEVKAENVLHLGVVDHERYPLSKKRVPLDTLRDWAHFRPRTTTVACIARISNALTHATHVFFEENGFLHVQVPVITTTDCEGNGNNFNVTTLLPKTMQEETDIDEGISLQTIKASIKEKSIHLEELRRTNSNRETLFAALRDLKKANEMAAKLEAKEKAKMTLNKRTASSASSSFKRVSFEEDFFACQAYLTVSGRLHLGSYACALGNVYSFGPRFKAEATHSPKQAAEVWKVEAEMAFAQVEEAVNCAIDYLKFLCKWVIDNCNEDLTFVLKRIDRTVIHRLESMNSADFERVSYSQAVDALKQVTAKKFQEQVEWGAPLSEEHESFLADEIYKKPIIVYDHPKENKPFYVRINNDAKTVGALVRGSQNEERLNMMNSRIRELGLASEQYEWYLDLCRHGTVKHSGFSLGFNTMVLLATGITNVDNVIPFPRTYGKASH
ncbi:hypothetical protein V2J09_004941 [Rumex salicifolius]